MEVTKERQVLVNAAQQYFINRWVPWVGEEYAREIALSESREFSCIAISVPLALFGGFSFQLIGPVNFLLIGISVGITVFANVCHRRRLRAVSRSMLSRLSVLGKTIREGPMLRNTAGFGRWLESEGLRPEIIRKLGLIPEV